MATTTKDDDSRVPNKPTALYLPSPVEAELFYYGLYSKPRLTACSSTYTYIWVEPRGPGAYFTPKGPTPLGFGHPLANIWEHKYSSLDPIRIGWADDPSPPAIIWVGVFSGTLTPEATVNVAIRCKDILSANSIDDVHVELCESEVFRCAKLYGSVPTFTATVRVIEPFSTAVGLPISTTASPTVGGTGGFFTFDPHYPGELFLMTARHVVMCAMSNENELFKYTNPSQLEVFISESVAKKHLAAISKLKKDAKAERDDAKPQLENAKKTINVLQAFLLDATRDWKDPENRVIGHVFLSPPITPNVGNSGFTEDWAVVKVDASRINSTNFVGKAVDLGINTPVDKFTSGFLGLLPDEEMWRPNLKTHDHDNDLVTMVMKCGHASGLTVGRLNTICSFTRCCFEGEDSIVSKEITVLPHNSESGPFSEPGDSGSSVVDGKGRIAGLLIGSAGVSDISDCTYITSINFLLERMAWHGLQANFFPSLVA